MREAAALAMTRLHIHLQTDISLPPFGHLVSQHVVIVTVTAFGIVQKLNSHSFSRIPLAARKRRAAVCLSDTGN